MNWVLKVAPEYDEEIVGWLTPRTQMRGLAQQRIQSSTGTNLHRNSGWDQFLRFFCSWPLLTAKGANYLREIYTIQSFSLNPSFNLLGWHRIARVCLKSLIKKWTDTDTYWNGINSNNLCLKKMPGSFIVNKIFFFGHQQLP